MLRFVRRFSSVAFSPRLVVSDLSAAALKSKNVFVRVDFNVPLSKKGAVTITDDTRIRESLPTIEYLLKHNARVILASHLGRPKTGPEDKLRLAPVAARLQELLPGRNVSYVKDCIGDDVRKASAALKDGSVLLLENTRFYKGEEKNDVKLSEQMASDTQAQVYVNDAFGAAHRAHCSTAGIRKFIKGQAASGLLMAKELKFLYNVRDNPQKPFVAIIGGAKVDTKIKVIESLMSKCSKMILGGGMINPFFRAMGLSAGSAAVEDSHVEIARRVLEQAKKTGVELVLPVDAVVAKQFSNESERQIVSRDKITPEWQQLDIGPKSVENIKKAVSGARTVFWNGPMGVFEFSNFANGTLETAKILAELGSSGAQVVVGGGDSVAAVQKAGLASKMAHISTGGGASIELLEGAALPGVECLDPK